MNKLLLSVVVILLMWSLGSAKNFENKKYKPAYSQLPLKVAILPVVHNDDEVKTTMDTVFEKLYFDTGVVLPLGPSELRQQLADDSLLFDCYRSIVEYKYTKEQRKAGPMLRDILDSAKVAYLQGALDSADMLLVPMKFGVGSLGIATGGALNLRLYDMRTGELVYEKDQDLNVNMTGKPGRDYLLLGLVAFTREPYHKWFLDVLKEH